MSIFRSEEMTLAQLFLQSEAAYACVRELGELGKVQFRDLNPEVSAFQRKFVNEVRRCDEMERKLRFLTNELEKADIEARPAGNILAPDPPELIDLETKFERLEAEVREMNTNKETLKRNLLDLIELQHILVKTQTFFQEAEQYSTMIAPRTGSPVPGAEPSSSGDDKRGLLEDPDTPMSSQTRFMFVAGVISQERLASFERVLWRACRGNVFIRQTAIEEPLEDPTTGANVFKVVFVLFFQGDALRTRVRKICEGFRATLYQCPESAQERTDMYSAVNNRIVDLRLVLQTTQDHSNTQLEDIAQEVDTWRQKVTKVKSIYHTMNMFNLDMAQHCLVAECWCPVEDLDEIRAGLVRGSERSGSTVPSILNTMSSKDEPPTYFKTNKFTKGFQNIVEAYGIASYREVNPSLYTIITFPFLFAVMFGDAGHGLIMAIFAMFLVIFEKRITAILAKGGGAMFGTIFHGRYIMLLMGLFSIYTGLIYNDIFSKSLNIFGSSWNASYSSVSNSLNKSDNSYVFPPDATTCCPFKETCVINLLSTDITTLPTEAQIFQQPYPFGIDPIWQVSENKLILLNSYKMKMSVILGVGQMLFGVLLGIFNYIHFKNYANIILDYIPQILFLMALFGWLVFLMFTKFVTFYEKQYTAPSLLITLISMVLKFGSTPALNGTGPPLPEDTYSVFYSSDRAGQATAATIQKFVQMFLVIIAVICIPWMLVPKPIYLYLKHKKAVKNQSVYTRHVETGSETEDNEQIMHHDDNEQPKSKMSDGDGEVEQFEIGEVIVNQSIHTIEYCLGTISNTASYLRLWALSLAHAELSEVLWTMVLKFGFVFGAESPAFGIIILIAVFFVWAGMTVGILLVMEGLSAFLHALRLHWVEFQSKFYLGQGEKFEPFSFEAILAGDES